MSHVGSLFSVPVFWLCLIASIKRFSLVDLLIIVIEDTMKISDMMLEMELNGVDERHIVDIVKVCKTKGFYDELIDNELTKRGYDKIFTVQYDSYDEYDDWEDWEDTEFSSIEKFPHKRSYID